MTGWRGYNKDDDTYTIDDVKYRFREDIGDRQVEALQAKVLELDAKPKNLDVLAEARKISREILETALVGVSFEKIQEKHLLPDIQNLAGEVLVFLLIRISKDEQSLLTLQLEATKQPLPNTQT